MRTAIFIQPQGILMGNLISCDFHRLVKCCMQIFHWSGTLGSTCTEVREGRKGEAWVSVIKLMSLNILENKQKSIKKTQYVFLRSVKKSFVKCPQPFSHYGQPFWTQVRSQSVLPHSCE